MVNEQAISEGSEGLLVRLSAYGVGFVGGIKERVLLGAPSIIAGAPSTNHEKIKISLKDQVDP